MEKNAPGKLFQQLLEAQPTDVEIHELYLDLCNVFDQPFDTKINEAMARGSTYMEAPQMHPN